MGMNRTCFGSRLAVSSLRKQGPIPRGFAVGHGSKSLLLMATSGIMGPCFRRDDTRKDGATPDLQALR